MSVPTESEEYSKLMEHMRQAQENAAMLAHLTRDYNNRRANQWLEVSELFKKLQYRLTALATGKLNYIDSMS